MLGLRYNILDEGVIAIHHEQNDHPYPTKWLTKDFFSI